MKSKIDSFVKPSLSNKEVAFFKPKPNASNLKLSSATLNNQPINTKVNQSTFSSLKQSVERFNITKDSTATYNINIGTNKNKKVLRLKYSNTVSSDYRDKPLPLVMMYKARRDKIFSKMQNNSFCVLSGEKDKARSYDTDFAFRQQSDFYYLTGFKEPNASLVLIKKDNVAKSILFCQDRVVENEIWEGQRYGVERANKYLGFDTVYSNQLFERFIAQHVNNFSNVYVSYDDSFMLPYLHNVLHSTAVNWRRVDRPMNSFRDIDTLIHALRKIKSKQEIDIMYEAAKISAQGHISAMKRAAPDVTEYELEAELLKKFAQYGAKNPAYSSIVAGGNNACILHYTENNQQIKGGDLVLIDAGCEHQMYASDISRTFPVNGKFNTEQKALYEVVLNAQVKAIEHARVGNTFESIHDVAVRHITIGLVKLGILSGNIDELIKEKAYKAFYMHQTCHWIGIDVHDRGPYHVKKDNGHVMSEILKEGMCLTVEPGLYISKNNKAVAPKWRGIGIRIEDDVVIQKEGPFVLSHDAPKTVQAIEQVMSAKG